MAALLQDLGQAVVPLPSAEAALAVLDDGQPACVVADVDLPGLSGIDLLDALRTRHPAIPTILIGGGGGVRSAVQALRHGARDYFERPVRRHALHESVAAILRARCRPHANDAKTTDGVQ